MREEISCFSCKYYNGNCCMKNCACRCIFDEWETAKECNDYIKGEYDANKLDKTNYK